MTHDTLAPWAERVPDVPERMTADELLALGDAGWRHELIEGRLVRMPPTGGGHGRASVKLSRALDAFVEQHSLGCVTGAETGFVISPPGEPETVLAPDVAYVRAEHVPARDTPEWDAFWRVAPDLVAEITSPSQFRPEMAEKARLWLRAGTRLVWVIWPAPSQRQVDVWRPGADQPVATLGADDTLDGMDVLPGLTLPIARIFA